MNHSTLRHVVISLVYFLCAGPVAAEFLDGGEVRFQGYVSDEGPRWTWQVASPQQNWPVDIANARTNGGWLYFSLSDGQTLPFLEGRLHRVAERGGAGYSPQIRFSSQGQPFELPNGGSMTDSHFRAAVPVTDPQSGNTVGHLAFTVEQGLAASFGRQDAGAGVPSGMTLLNGSSVSPNGSLSLSQTLNGRLSALLQMTPDFGNGMSAISNGQALPQSILMSEKVMNIAAAYASILSAFELVLPEDHPPAQWQAKLGVVVTVQ